MMIYYVTLWSFCLSLALADPAALQTVSSSSKHFASSLYKQVVRIENGNFLFSPLSAEISLVLLQSGAGGPTGEEIRTVLQLPHYQPEIEASFKNLKEDLGKQGVYVLNSANKIYTQNGFRVTDSFKKFATDVFGSEAENVDFSQSQQTADSINQWVEGRTGNKIKNLIKPDDFGASTRLVLVNALHFKANWSNGFQNKTEKKDFFVDGQNAIQVDTMNAIDHRSYYESQELKARFLELPFQGGDVTFTIVLPNEKTGLPALESRLDEVFQTPNYTKKRVETFLPKFKSESKLDLKEILQKLGVNTVFSPSADLGGLLETDAELYVDKVMQKSFIAVDEKGVEAAAATASVAVARDSVVPIEFKVDHPFIYYIKLKDVIVFAGRVVDPTK